MDSMFTSDFSLHLVLLPTTLASVVAAVLVVLLLSEVPPIRKIFRLDLAEATKVIE
jgi:hypothetical protein